MAKLKSKSVAHNITSKKDLQNKQVGKTSRMMHADEFKVKMDKLRDIFEH